jgi:phage gp36-like protein
LAYCTITDLTRWIESEELVRLCSSDQAATIGSVNVLAVTGEAIQSADSQIDSYLLGRWPGLRSYDPVPDEIGRLSAVLVVYQLYLRRRAVSGMWRTSYQDCLERLEAASRGELDLGLDEEGGTAAGPEAVYRTDALETDRVYDREKMDKF